MSSLLGDVLRTHPFQDNYLIEVRGDVQESLPSMDEDKGPSTTDGENVRVYYMVHPSVDTEEPLQ